VREMTLSDAEEVPLSRDKHFRNFLLGALALIPSDTELWWRMVAEARSILSMHASSDNGNDESYDWSRALTFVAECVGAVEKAGLRYPGAVEPTLESGFAGALRHMVPMVNRWWGSGSFREELTGRALAELERLLAQEVAVHVGFREAARYCAVYLSRREEVFWDSTQDRDDRPQWRRFGTGTYVRVSGYRETNQLDLGLPDLMLTSTDTGWTLNTSLWIYDATEPAPGRYEMAEHVIIVGDNGASLAALPRNIASHVFAGINVAIEGDAQRSRG